MKSPGVSSTLVVLALGAVALCGKSDGFMAGLFFVPFALGPLFVSLLLALVLQRKPKSQMTLLVGSVLYAAWFTFVYLDVFFWHLDAQSAIGLLFVGVYSLPVMIVVWLIAILSGRTKAQNTPA